MLSWSLALLLAAAPERWGVIAAAGAGDDPAAALAAASELTRRLALRAPAGPADAAALGDVREVGGEPPAEAARLLDEAGSAFDYGVFDRAADLARQAAARLAAAPRSVAVEEAERRAQVLWGLALVAAHAAGGGDHLAWAAAREEGAPTDLRRFVPPLRARMQEARKAIRARPPASVTVSGSAGASVYVDGVLHGDAPLTLTTLAPRRAWIWLERAGRRSLAHAVTLGAEPVSVAIDLELESRLSLEDRGRLVLRVAPGDPETRALLERLGERLRAGAMALVFRGPGPTSCRVEVARDGRTSTWTGTPAVLADRLAGALPAGVAAAAVAEPVTASAVRSRPAWPWIAGGAVLVAAGTGLALYFALRGSPDLSFSTQTGGL